MSSMQQWIGHVKISALTKNGKEGGGMKQVKEGQREEPATSHRVINEGLFEDL